MNQQEQRKGKILVLYMVDLIRIKIMRNSFVTATVLSLIFIHLVLELDWTGVDSYKSLCAQGWCNTTPTPKYTYL